MSSKNFSFDLKRPSLNEYSDEIFYKQFDFLKDEMTVKGNIVSNMLKDYKKEMAQFQALKKIIDHGDCPALLQSTAYNNLNSSTINFDAKQLRFLGIEYIISIYSKINHLYWIALFDKLNLSRIIHTRIGENILGNMQQKKYLKFEDAFAKFGYSDLQDGVDVDLENMCSIYISPDFTAKNISVLLKEIVKPLTKQQIQEEFDILVSKGGLKAEYKLDSLVVSGSRSDVCKHVVSLLYMVTDKKDWLEKLTVNHLTSEKAEDRLRLGKIPSQLIGTFELFYGKVDR